MKRKSLLLASSCLVMMGAAACSNFSDVTMPNARVVGTASTVAAASVYENNNAATYAAQAAATQGAAYAAGFGGAYPANAEPGKCYARVVIPATYRSVEQQVVDREASTQLTVTPATYKTVSETVVVQEASERLVVVPATYKTVTETVEVEEPSQTLQIVPATFKDVTEVIEVQPAYEQLQVVPATFKTVTQTVVTQEAYESLEVVPATYKTVSIAYAGDEGAEELRVIPAEYETVTETVVVEEASEQIRVIPATYRTVTETVQVRDAYTTWKRGQNPIAILDAVGGEVTGAAIKQTKQLNTGEIMCLVQVPAQFETITRQVVDQAARSEVVVIPAKTATITRQIVKTPARVVRVDGSSYQGGTTIVDYAGNVIPGAVSIDAQGYAVGANGQRIADANGQAIAARAVASGNGVGYGAQKTYTKRVVDTPATVRRVTVPAQSRTVEIRVVDQPATVQRVTVPAQTATITRRVVDRPAATQAVGIPGKSATVSRRVVDTPASVRREIVPAVTRTVERRIVDRPAGVSEQGVPASVKTVVIREKVSDESLQWREVLCETNASPEVIRRLQEALKQRGYYQGAIDGAFGPTTNAAVERYQRSAGEGTGGLTVDTLKSLGISIR